MEKSNFFGLYKGLYYMKEKFWKIKFIIYFCYFNIIFSVILGILSSFVTFNHFPKNINIVFSVIIFLIVTFLLLFIDYKMGLFLLKKEYSKHSDYLCINLSNTDKNELLQNSKLEKVSDNVYIYSLKKRMLYTISFYLCDNINNEDFKKSKNICDNYIKNKYPMAKCKDVTKPHWLIKGQIVVSNSNNFSGIGSYLKQNMNQLYEIGLIRCFFAIDKSKIIIPFYKNLGLDIISFKRYQMLLKLLLNLFEFMSIEEFDMLKYERKK